MAEFHLINMLRVPFLLLLTMAYSGFAWAQYLHPPLDGTLKASGSFGEVRSGHFHTGVDLKTDGKIDLPVRAVKAGVVVRIKVEIRGYGKAIYLNHDDGTTSVYAHLNRFEDAVNNWVKQKQYAKENYEVDLNPPTGKFRFEAGDIIAYSGNSGGSGGPHVHFEIRETASQKPINPTKHGLIIDDQNPPELSVLALYGHGNSSVDKEYLAPKKVNGKTVLEPNSPIEVFGNLSFGIGVIDRHSTSPNPCGIYSIDLEIDGRPFYSMKFDKLDFSTKRYVNAHVDYRYRNEKKVPVHRTYRAPNNGLDIYSSADGDGIFTVKAGMTHNCRYTVVDHFGNSSELKFSLVGKNFEPREQPTVPANMMFYPDRENHFSVDELKFSTPKNAVYDTLQFQYQKRERNLDCLSKVHGICDLGTPLHKYCTISIKVDEAAKKLKDRLLVISFRKKGKPIAEGGTYKDGWMTTRTRSFGDYAVMADTLAPELEFRSKSVSITLGDTLHFFIDDDLSGISNITLKSGNQWLLLEWDYKTGKGFYVVDEKLNHTSPSLRLNARDKVGNRSALKP